MRLLLYFTRLKRHLLNKIKRTDNPNWNDQLFEGDVINEIHLYGVNVPCMKGKTRKILVELHLADGFAFIKFYPKRVRSYEQRYQLRGKNQLGFEFPISSVKAILLECAYVMNEYLENNPDNFIGYVGQTDDRDNKPNKYRVTAQRADIYNLYTNSIFLSPKYKLSSQKVFQEVNLRLIRRVRSKQEGKINKIQTIN